MRLNYKTWPIWRVLEDGILKSDELNGFSLAFVESAVAEFKTFDLQREGLTKLLLFFNGVSKKAMKGTIYFLTEPFLSAIEKATPKILNKDRRYLDSVPPVGIFLSAKGGSMFWHDPVKFPEGKLLMFGFSRERIEAYGVLTHDNSIGGFVNEEWLKEWTGESFDHGNSVEMYMDRWFTGVLITNYFIENCEIETKVLGPNQKMRIHGDRHFNESKQPLTVLDCTWFTKLVSMTPQTVHGHYRWQPCGPGRAKVKLIYIEEFERGGFKKEAKKQ